jgi:hypothetical protein
LGGHFIKGESVCPAQAIQQILTSVGKYGSVKTGRFLILLEETSTVPLKKQGIYHWYLLTVIPKYIFLKVFTAFVKTLYSNQPVKV